MHKIIFRVALFSAAASIYGCSTQAYVEKASGSNLSDYKTYMWVNAMANKNDSSARATAFADVSVHNSVNEQLQHWGWRETNVDPDVLISYDILVEKNVETQNDALYTPTYTRWYYNRFTSRWSTIYYPSRFWGYQQYQVPVKEVTITITIIDADSDKNIWQGWTTESLGSSGLTHFNIKKSVKNIFKKSDRSSAKGAAVK